MTKLIVEAETKKHLYARADINANSLVTKVNKHRIRMAKSEDENIYGVCPKAYKKGDEIKELYVSWINVIVERIPGNNSSYEIEYSI